MIDNIVCPCCGSHDLRTIYRQSGVPVHSVVLIPGYEEARSYPRGEIRLQFCEACGFILNDKYDPSLLDYSKGYESTQSYSNLFNRFNAGLAESLVDRYDLHGCDILEIGCGQGEFLTLLCEAGKNSGLGFDPAYHGPGKVDYPGYAIRFISDYFGEDFAGIQADLVCCKMTLEHIPNPREFIATMVRSIDLSRDPVFYLQVPNTTRILREIAFWDIYYEHCSYFTPHAMIHLLESLGMQILESTTGFEDQYILIEARCSAEPVISLLEAKQRLVQDVEMFASIHGSRIGHWRDRIKNLHASDRRIVIWGAGSKGVTFLTTLDVNEEVRYAVDINPVKANTYLACSGQMVVNPPFLQQYRPDAIIVMNPIYLEEIGSILSRLKVEADLIPVD